MSELVIEKLKSNFDSGARANRFGTHFMCPKLGVNLDGVRCKTANIPGRQLEAVDWSAYGATHTLPQQVNHDGQRASFTFLCDTSFSDRFLIEAWQLFIIGDDSLDGSGAMHPRFAYQMDYVGTVDVYQFNQNSDKALIVHLHDAFPLSIETQTLDYGDVDTIMEVTVEFAFRYYTSEFTQVGNSAEAVQGGLLGLINKGRQALDIIGDVAKVAGRFSPEADRFFRKVAKLEGTVDRATGISNKIDRNIGNAPKNLLGRFFGGG
jgi:hypothetical protein